jgi:hypothetical protein
LFVFMVLFVGSGGIARMESNYEDSIVGRSFERARNVVSTCQPNAQNSIKRALLTYLAIEDIHRPAWFRKLELGVAAVSNSVGIASFHTLGVGQISYETYIRQRSATSPFDWILATRDDCESIAILIGDLGPNMINCTADSARCSLEFICHWHVGDTHRCLFQPKHRAYVIAATRLILRDPAD